MQGCKSMNVLDDLHKIVMLCVDWRHGVTGYENKSTDKM